MKEVLNFLKYTVLSGVEFIVKFGLVFGLIPLLSFLFTSYIGVLTADIIPYELETFWTIILILIIPLVFVIIGWKVVFINSKDIIKAEDYIDESIDSLKLKSYIRHSLSNIPMGVDYHTVCTILRGMKGVKEPFYLCQNGNFDTYIWYLDLFVKDEKTQQKRKAHFTMDFNNNILVSINKSDLY